MFLKLLVPIGLFNHLVSQTKSIKNKILGTVDQREDEVDFGLDIFIILHFQLGLDGLVIRKLKN